MYKLNRRVTVERYENTQDEYGGVTSVVAESWEKWAQVDVRSGNVTQEVNQVMWSYSTKIIMRRFSSRPMKSNYCIVYEGDRYRVDSVAIENEGFKHFEVCRCTKIDTNVSNGNS